ncbi:MAG: caspase family protein, partial [Candidatus Puniceispirillales bacterium]
MLILNLLTSAFNYNFDMPLATASNLEQSTTPTSSELLAAQQEAEVLKQQLAELQAQQPQTQQATSADTQIPIIIITRADTDDKQGIIVGRVSDNVGVAEVTVDGNVIPFSSNGSFEYSTYVPATGLSVVVEVTDFAGLSSTQTITLERNVNLATASISFDRLNPIAKQAKRNNNALALIIGVSDYRNTPAKAIYADTDAMVFRDYASEKLGIPDNRIKTLVNDGADIREFLLSTQNWLSRSVKQDQTDVYVFFAGHGLASDDGEQMYLLPYDGSPELLDRT